MTVEEYIEILERYYRIPENVKKDLKNCRAGVESELGDFEKNDIKQVVEDYCLDVDPKFFPKLGYIVAKLNREIQVATDVKDFVDKWNWFVKVYIKSANQFAKGEMTDVETAKNLIPAAKKKLLDLIERLKSMPSQKIRFITPKVSLDDIWGFAINVFAQRRAMSDFLYNECRITARFFCDRIDELANPYSDIYLNDNEKYPHR